MECPICRSAAVVAKTCIENYVELVQQGVDPYDLICRDQAEAECRSCGHVFVPGAEAQKPDRQP